MCIIIAKPTGIDIPSEETLDSCFSSNRDGIGFSYALQDGKVTISKGYANVKKLIKMLNTHEVTKEHNLIIHFRFATHGKKDPGNCHPFPLSPSFDDMRLLDCTCGTAIAHNGVFSGVQAHPDHSDTMKFIGGVLAQPEIIDNLDSKAVKELIRGYCGYSSKLAFLKSSGLKLIGDFELNAGVYYSNSQYKKWGNYKNDWDNDYDCKSYCYIHKVKDDCCYCQFHKTWDSCFADRASLWKNRYNEKEEKKLLLESCCDVDLRTKCLWCLGTEKVKWDEEADGFLCDQCALLYAGQKGTY